MKVTIKAKGLNELDSAVSGLAKAMANRLVKRTYRITVSQDKKVKKLAKGKSESQVVREAIDLKPTNP